MSERVGAEQTPDIEALAAAIWAHTGETCSVDCGEGFGYHDLDSSEERRRGCLHVAQALAPVLAAAVREARAAAWDRACNWLDAHDDSDVRDRVKDAAWASNPYRADRIAVDAPEGDRACIFDPPGDCISETDGIGCRACTPEHYADVPEGGA